MHLTGCINVAALYNEEQLAFIIIDIHVDCTPYTPDPRYGASPTHQLTSDENATSCSSGVWQSRQVYHIKTFSSASTKLYCVTQRTINKQGNHSSQITWV